MQIRNEKSCFAHLQYNSTIDQSASRTEQIPEQNVLGTMKNKDMKQHPSQLFQKSEYPWLPIQEEQSKQSLNGKGGICNANRKALAVFPNGQKWCVSKTCISFPYHLCIFPTPTMTFKHLLSLPSTPGREGCNVFPYFSLLWCGWNTDHIRRCGWNTDHIRQCRLAKTHACITLFCQMWF